MATREEQARSICKDLYKRLDDNHIDYKTNRWAEGIPHNPLSEEIVRLIADLDFAEFGDYFCWKVGGDGDNGEALMYEMDVILELLEAEKKAK